MKLQLVKTLSPVCKRDIRFAIKVHLRQAIRDMAKVWYFEPKNHRLRLYSLILYLCRCMEDVWFSVEQIKLSGICVGIYWKLRNI